MIEAVAIDFAVSASPMPTSFGSFLVRRQERNISPIRYSDDQPNHLENREQQYPVSVPSPASATRKEHIPPFGTLPINPTAQKSLYIPARNAMTPIPGNPKKPAISTVTAFMGR